ncbi:MAG: cobalt transport protein CbiN [Lachnospiraceae bacterium]|nr:cobalt transport protein CbiN [Lachnospiraceae bacterium]MDE6980335.1 cobalt transport protein CbiN [Lachnospiraceae bacterium]
MCKSKKAALILIALICLIALFPLFALKGAEFGGSDDAASQVVESIQGDSYEPWFTPVLETLIGGELPGEIESLFFCVQTGIGVGIIAYGFGYLAARKKYKGDNQA